MSDAQVKNQWTAKKQGAHAGSTQKFSEIEDIFDDIVVYKGGYASLVIEVQASNFALLSESERDAKLSSYAALLNSLSFPVQILIRNKKIDISSYMRLIDQELTQSSSLHLTLSQQQRELLIRHMKMYRDFVQNLVKINTVLDKKFYMVISYSYLEGGVGNVATGLTRNVSISDSFIQAAKAALHTKAESLHAQLQRLALRARTLERDELIKLFYSMYNETQTGINDVAHSVKTPIVSSAEK